MVQEEIIKLLPLISEANCISEELNKYITFELIIVPSIALDNQKEANSASQKLFL